MRVDSTFFANAISSTYLSARSPSAKQMKIQREESRRGTDTPSRTNAIGRTWRTEQGKMRLPRQRPKRQCYRKGELHGTIAALIKENQEQEQMFPRDTNEQKKNQHFPPSDSRAHDSSSDCCLLILNAGQFPYRFSGLVHPGEGWEGT